LALSISRGLLFLATAAVAAGPVLAEIPTSPNASVAAGVPLTAAATPPVSYPTLSQSGATGGGDLDALSTAIAAARHGQASAAQAAMAQMSDPTVRKVALWALIDADGEQLPFFNSTRRGATWPAGPG
jgi:soluble lytic murein transglycosylase